MKHHVYKKELAPTVAVSLSSIILSVFASSHHWLHMLLLLILGGSTGTLASATGMSWVRRAMILASVISTAFALYRLLKRKQIPLWMRGITYLSVIISVAFILYSLIQYGW